MRVLVTGGAGFIGSHTCKALALAGHEPIVYDSLITGHRSAVKWGPLVEGDILDADALDRTFQTHKPDMVMHFAAFAYVGESVHEPLKYYTNNVAGSLNLLTAMRRNNVGSIVFSSTCATYGVPATVPIDETMAQEPINPYGYTKLAVERMLKDCAQAYGLKWCALRYFNAAGCDPDGEIGEDHEPETHAIPLAIRAALGRSAAFHVFGTDYDTEDGSAVRDYIHVSDLADAHVKAADYLGGGGTSQAFNLATGKGVSVLELLQAVERATGTKVPAVYGPRRAGDPPVLFAVATKARDILGWTPKFTSIDDTVLTAVEWVRRQDNQKSSSS